MTEREAKLELVVKAAMRLRRSLHDEHPLLKTLYAPRAEVERFDALIEQLKKERDGANNSKS